MDVTKEKGQNGELMIDEQEKEEAVPVPKACETASGESGESLTFYSSSIPEFMLPTTSANGSSDKASHADQGAANDTEIYQGAVKVKVKKATRKKNSAYSNPKKSKSAKAKPADDPEKLQPGQVSNDEFVVEKICDKQIIAGRALYFIKWKGWTAVHNTWEPIANLSGCPSLLEKFERDLEEKQTQKKSKSKKSATKAVEGKENKAVDDNSSAIESSDEETGIDSRYLDRSFLKQMKLPIQEMWPSMRIPVTMLGSFAVDSHLAYLIQCIPMDAPANFVLPSKVTDIPIDDFVVVKATAFRRLFPQIVIEFYQNRIMWLKSHATDEDVAKKAASAMNTKKDSETMLQIDVETEKIKVNPAGNHLVGMTIASRERIDSEETEKMEVDGADSDDDNQYPKISIKSDEQLFGNVGQDVFGLPDDLNSSSSDSGDEYTDVSGTYMNKI